MPPPNTLTLTLVTELYDLQKIENIERKSIDFYLKEGTSFVLSLNCNLVIFTEHDLFWPIYNIRKTYNLQHKTLIIVEEFTDLRYYKSLETITKYHENTQPINNLKDTPNFKAVIYNKFDCIDKVIEKNPFNTTHVGWIDFGISYCTDLVSMESVLSYLPNLVHVFLYKYLELSVVNSPDYYKTNIQRVSGGFWVGPLEKTKIFVQDCIKEIENAFSNQFSPFEEQVIAKIICKNKVFKYSYGTHRDIFKNWLFPDGANIDITIFKNIVFPALIHKLDPYIALVACDDVLEAWDDGLLHLKNHQIFHLFDEMMQLLLNQNDIEKAKFVGAKLYDLLEISPAIFAGTFPIWRNERLQNKFNFAGIKLPFAYNTSDYGLIKLTSLKNKSEYVNVLINNFHHFVKLQKLSPRVTGCGSYLIDGISSLDYSDVMISKQENLYNNSKGKKSALEIGFYAGHSALIMLLANIDNPDFKLISIDICYFDFTEPCAKYLQQVFPGKLTFIKGSSLTELPNVLVDNNVFDLYHIDGDHGHIVSEETQLIIDFNIAQKQSKVCVIFDDYKMSGTQEAIKNFSQLKILEVPDCYGCNVVCSLEL